MHSYTKEARSHDPLNLVAVIEHERSLGLNEALDVAVEIYHSDLDWFMASKAAIEEAPDASATEIAIARGLCDWVNGNFVWTMHCGRYHTTPMKIPHRLAMMRNARK
jgi:hypothetical protein